MFPTIISTIGSAATRQTMSATGVALLAAAGRLSPPITVQSKRFLPCDHRIIPFRLCALLVLGRYDFMSTSAIRPQSCDTAPTPGCLVTKEQSDNFVIADITCSSVAYFPPGTEYYFGVAAATWKSCNYSMGTEEQFTASKRRQVCSLNSLLY